MAEFAIGTLMSREIQILPGHMISSNIIPVFSLVEKDLTI